MADIGDTKSDSKMIPESDLMAVKAKAERLESQNAELTTQLEEWKANASTSQDAFRRTEAERDTALAQIEELTGQVVEVGSLKSQLSDIQVQLKDATKSVLDFRRSNLKDFGVPDDLLEGKTAQEMQTMHAVLVATNRKSSPRLDDGGGSGQSPQTSRDKILAGLEGGALKQHSADSRQ